MQTISERLKLNTDSKIRDINFSYEELTQDYFKVKDAYLKSDKDLLAKKYNAKSSKIQDIAIVILDKIREYRNEKTKFEEDDIKWFLRYDMSDTYNKFKEYLDKESQEFIEYMLEFWNKKSKKINRSYMSSYDRLILRRISNLKKYLSEKYKIVFIKI